MSENITDASLREAMHIYNASVPNAHNKSNIPKSMNYDQSLNTNYDKYIYPTFIILPLCVAILTILACNVSCMVKLIVSFMILFTLVIYIFSVQKYDIVSIFKNLYPFTLKEDKTNVVEAYENHT